MRITSVSLLTFNLRYLSYLNFECVSVLKLLSKSRVDCSWGGRHYLPRPDRHLYLQHGELADDFFYNVKQLCIRYQTTNRK